MTAKKLIALDIRPNAVKLAEIGVKDTGCDVSNYSIDYLEKDNAVELLYGILKTSLTKNKIITKDAVIALSGEDVSFKLIDLPQMPEKEIDQAIKHKIENIAGIPAEKLIFDYYKTDSIGDSGKQFYFASYISKEYADKIAVAAQKAGLVYIAITDHTKSLAMTGGADEKKLLRQMKEIDRINAAFVIRRSSFVILKGAEVNIGKDGSLDIRDDVLAKLDVAGAAVHSHFNLPRHEQTRRIIRAMENPHVDIIFHLTTRIINRREPIDLEVDEVIAAAKRTGTILEIDAYPDRLDIKDDYVRKCVKAGVKMVIDSDAHSIQHFKYLEMGIAQARRGWAARNDIINAWPVEKMLKMLK